ncbi:CBS domain-containing protein [Desulfogranum mediterraneum]|uniref:CBS domain-containing protein n=1 Tax=Desulfogranum mediterraneum TaxID=160661 RepID=UPI0003F96152|nr:CBS domain-containing protein [Desulfogranum mediterraneum]
MEKICVKDLMVPISEYATVTVGTSLIDAVLALEAAQEAYSSSKYEHRAILVLDENHTVIGKIGQLRILKAIETRYDLGCDVEKLSRFKFSDQYIADKCEQYRLEGPILDEESFRTTANKKVEEFMQRPTSGEFVSEESSLDMAIHKLVAGPHLSLLVTKEEEIVGILKIGDVFASVFHKMRNRKGAL